MKTLNDLSVKQLHAVLAKLRGGSIGFDPFRNSETSTKGKVIAYMQQHHRAEYIDAAIRAVTGASAATAAAQDACQTTEQDEQAQADATTATAKASKADACASSPEITADAKTQQLARLLADLAGSKAAPLDESKVRDIVDEQLAKIHLPTRVEIKTQAGEVKDCGIQHVNFPHLVMAANARDKDGHRLNIWLKGPAGTGKTSAGKEIAKALGIPFYSNGALDVKFELTGFRDAKGEYQATEFRKAWEHGGVFLFDECDNSSPQALTCFNAALANGFFPFPDQTIARHPDCLVLAGANTAGKGATDGYLRSKLDGAFLDRFVILDWSIDESLELALASNKDWCKRVQAVRSKAKERGIKDHLITPRATFFGEALLASGMPWPAVEAMTLKKSLSDDAWSQVCV